MSEIRATTISNAAGTGPATLTGQSAAKAYFDIDQLSNVIIGSFNVSSFTDVSVGRKTANFTNNFSTTSDLVQVSDANIGQSYISTRQVDLITTISQTSAGTNTDTNLNTGIVMGALA